MDVCITTERTQSKQQRTHINNELVNTERPKEHEIHSEERNHGHANGQTHTRASERKPTLHE